MNAGRWTERQPTGRIGRRDLYVAAVLVLVALAYAFLFFDARRLPSEDAAMLMRYATHVAQGHGFVWNIGEAPVDGATDFLFTLTLAGLQKIGLTAEQAVHLACTLAHLATTLLVYFGAVRHFRAPRWVAALSAAFLAVGPGTLYIEAYFGAPFFAFFVCLMWYVGLLALERGGSRSTSIAFALVALAAGLVRPEGVLIACLVLLALLYRAGFRRMRTTAVIFVLVFAVIGGAYLLWRMRYFGYPLPNPYYVKGGGQLHLSSLQVSAGNVFSLSFPFSVVLILGLVAAVSAFLSDVDRARLALRMAGAGALLLFLVGLRHTSHPPAGQWQLLERYSARYTAKLALLLLVGVAGLPAAGVNARALSRWFRAAFSRLGLSEGERSPLENAGRDVILVLIPVVGFTLMWILVDNRMNFLMRFQYPILPVILMSWWMWSRSGEVVRRPGSTARLRRIGALGLAVFVVLAVGATIRQHTGLNARKHRRDGRYDVAMVLREYGVNRFTLATTEAGLLPLYSGWRAVDLIGLNDKWIAHHGLVTDAYLDGYRPDVIVLAAPYPIDQRPVPNETAPRRTVRRAGEYARKRGYTLAAAYGSDSSKVHYYYVSPGFPDQRELVDRIRSMTYSWYLNGDRSIDFAGSQEGRSAPPPPSGLLPD